MGSIRLRRVVCGVAPQTTLHPSSSLQSAPKGWDAADGATPSAARRTRALPKPNRIVPAEGACGGAVEWQIQPNLGARQGAQLPARLERRRTRGRIGPPRTPRSERRVLPEHSRPFNSSKPELAALRSALLAELPAAMDLATRGRAGGETPKIDLPREQSLKGGLRGGDGPATPLETRPATEVSGLRPVLRASPGVEFLSLLRRQLVSTGP
jgi:hypothetical protein